MRNHVYSLKKGGITIVSKLKKVVFEEVKGKFQEYFSDEGCNPAK